MVFGAVVKGDGVSVLSCVVWLAVNGVKDLREYVIKCGDVVWLVMLMVLKT